MPLHTACVRAAAFAIAAALGNELCLAQDRSVAGTTAVQEPGSTGAQEWESIDRFRADAVRDFLARHPDSPIREQIQHRLVLMEKMEAIESGRRAAITIPFATLAPWLPAWLEAHRNDPRKTVCRYTIWRSEGLMGIGHGTMLGEPGCALRSREDGSVWPVMGRGTIVAIRTNEMEYRWPEEGGTFIADHRSTLIFGVLPKLGGLVFLEGKGRYIRRDGTQIELSEE